MKKILLIRPDRMGDVMLSLPVAEALRDRFPQAEITMMVRELAAPLVRHAPDVDRVLVFDPKQPFFDLVREIRREGFDLAVTLQSHRRLAAAVFGAGVRFRVGPWSKPHSFLFYNRGRRQKRSQVQEHEAIYNLELLERVGVELRRKKYYPRLELSRIEVDWAKGWLDHQSWQEEPFVAIHPGMGGSALNWPEENYVELVRQNLDRGRRVLLTFGPADLDLRERFLERLEVWKDHDNLRVYCPQTGEGADLLAGLYSLAHLVIAPSTGPLHIAAAVGSPVLGFYPPIRVMTAKRWGPLSDTSERVHVLEPAVACGESFRCAGKTCKYYYCMKQISVSEAQNIVDRYL